MYNQANLWLSTITGNAKSGSALKRSHKPSTVGLNTYCQYVQRESKRQIYHYKEKNRKTGWLKSHWMRPVPSESWMSVGWPLFCSFLVVKDNFFRQPQCINKTSLCDIFFFAQ